MNTAVFDDIYAEVLSRVRESSIFGTGKDQIKPTNLQEYSTEDATKRRYSTSDYPRMEIVPVSLEPAGYTSSSWNFLQRLRVTVAVGKMDFSSRLFPIQMEMLRIASQLASWRKPYENGDSVLGSAYSGVTYGKYAPERGEDTEDGWGFQFTIDFRIHLKQEP